MINIAVLGYGTVGSGVVEVLDTNRECISQRVGEEIRVKYSAGSQRLSGRSGTEHTGP